MVSKVLTATDACCECRITAGGGRGVTPDMTTQPLALELISDSL